MSRIEKRPSRDSTNEQVKEPASHKKRDHDDDSTPTLGSDPTNDNDEIDPSLMENHIQHESVVNQVDDISQGSIIVVIGVGIVRVDQDLLRQVNQSNQKRVAVVVVVDLKGQERERIRDTRKSQTRRNAEGVVVVRARVKELVASNRKNLNFPRVRAEGRFKGTNSCTGGLSCLVIDRARAR